AAIAASATDASHHSLVTLYFSAGYFGTSQAICLDAIRYGIASTQSESQLWLVAAWLACAARIANSPGHAAQYLKPTSDSSFARIRRQWLSDPWSLFLETFFRLQSEGTHEWSERYSVT